MPTLFFDTETTGKYEFKLPIEHPAQPDLVQIAAMLDDDEGKTIAEINYIIHPYGFTIPVDAANIHGITQTMAEEKGVEASVALAQFAAMLTNDPIIVAHNFDFDEKIIRIAASRLNLRPLMMIFKNPRSFCTMQNATNICKIPSPRGHGYKWPTLMEAYQLLVDPAGFDGAHDALNDVRACRAVYYALRDRQNAK